MKHVDPQNDLNDGFEPGPIVAGPDGTLKMANKALRLEPPRLCQAGPCRHYHTFAIQMDVETPKGDSVKPGGKVEGGTQEQPFYVERHHYCYPTVGIETTLGALPVLECSLWEPIGVHETNRLAGTRDAFNMTASGIEWRHKFEAWKASLTASAAASITHVRVDFGGMIASVAASSSSTVADILATVLQTFPTAGPEAELVDGDGSIQPKATMGQLGIAEGHLFKLIRKGA